MAIDDVILKLKRSILKSGFPLEIRVASVVQSLLNELGDDVDVEISTSPYYVDKDEGKGRELDIKVSILIFAVDLPTINLNLLIQCKNIPGNSWVFYNTSQDVCHVRQMTSVLDAINWIPREHYSYVIDTKLHEKKLPITTIYSEFVTDKKKSNGKNNNLFESIISLAKATSFDIEGDKAQFKKSIDRGEPFRDIDFVTIYYAVIIFNGNMFLADAVEQGENMRLNAVKHIGCFVDYASGSYDIDLLVEVVHESGLDDYIRLVKEDITRLKTTGEGKTGVKYLKEVLQAEREYKRRQSSSKLVS